MSSFENMSRALLNLTSECRTNMHEPDEQGFKRVRLVGDHLDNAMGEQITPEAVLGNWQEYVLIICKDETEGSTGENVPFNLASLLALARFGAQQILDTENTKRTD